MPVFQSIKKYETNEVGKIERFEAFKCSILVEEVK